jgi:hypothetical protein
VKLVSWAISADQDQICFQKIHETVPQKIIYSVDIGMGRLCAEIRWALIDFLEHIDWDNK